MILVDANLLICAYAKRMPQHGAARRWPDTDFARFPHLRWENPLA